MEFYKDEKIAPLVKTLRRRWRNKCKRNLLLYVSTVFHKFYGIVTQMNYCRTKKLKKQKRQGFHGEHCLFRVILLLNSPFDVGGGACEKWNLCFIIFYFFFQKMKSMRRKKEKKLECLRRRWMALWYQIQCRSSKEDRTVMKRIEQLRINAFQIFKFVQLCLKVLFCNENVNDPFIRFQEPKELKIKLTIDNWKKYQIFLIFWILWDLMFSIFNK